MDPLLVTAEFVFSEEGEAQFLPHLDRTMAETRGIEGCLQAVVWTRPGRRYQFATLWTDSEAVTRWVANEFHRTVLMPGFRKWCTEGCFGEFTLTNDHKRARKCKSCGRWTQSLPGWNEALPSACEKCGAEIQIPDR